MNCSSTDRCRPNAPSRSLNRLPDGYDDFGLQRARRPQRIHRGCRGRHLGGCALGPRCARRQQDLPDRRGRRRWRRGVVDLFGRARYRIHGSQPGWQCEGNSSAVTSWPPRRNPSRVHAKSRASNTFRVVGTSIEVVAGVPSPSLATRRRSLRDCAPRQSWDPSSPTIGHSSCTRSPRFRHRWSGCRSRQTNRLAAQPFPDPG